MTRRALLLDRDGTLIVDVGYPRDPERVELLPGAADAMRRARDAGYQLAIVSNQSGVARGIIAPAEATAVQARVEELFAREGVRFDGAYFCFHGPDDGCRCRKPSPGLLEEARRHLALEFSGCVMVGDKPSDVAAGRAVGSRTVAFGQGACGGATVSCPTWADFSTWLALDTPTR